MTFLISAVSSTRRRPGLTARFGVGASAALLVSLLAPLAGTPVASADQIGDKRAQAEALAQEISRQQAQVEVLSNQYDAATIQVQQVGQRLTGAEKSLAVASTRVSKAQVAVAAEAVAAYTHGGYNSTPGSALLGGRLQPAIQQAYFEVATGSQTDSIDQLHEAQGTYNVQKQALEQAQKAAENSVAQLASSRQAVVTANDQAQATLNQVNGQIATLVAQAQAAAAAALRAKQEAEIAAQIAQQQAAAQAAALRNQQLAAAALAASQASSTVAPAPGVTSPAATQTQTPTATPSNTTAPVGDTPTTTYSAPAATAPDTTVPAAVPSSGSGASTAVSVAMGQIGKPYVWGAAGPDSFDCSGLVQYAYAAAGVSLPHYTGSQWADTAHISMGDLQPGDLVFFDGLNHVGIYIGGGQMVDAPHTGADVRVESIYGFGSIDGATRVQ